MCCLDRRLIAYEPLVKNYDMLFLQCPDSKSVISLCLSTTVFWVPEDALVVGRSP
jgi:hypothetical protein